MKNNKWIWMWCASVWLVCACGSTISIPNFPEETTMFSLDGPRCKSAATCECRSLDGKTTREQEIAEGHSRFEFVIPRTKSGVWVEIGDRGVYYKPKGELGRTCLYVDLPRGVHRVRMVSVRNHSYESLKTGLEVYRYGEIGEEPKVEVAEKPEAEVAEKPEAEVAEKPEAEVAEKPEAEVGEEPAGEIAEKPKAEIAEGPEPFWYPVFDFKCNGSNACTSEGAKYWLQKQKSLPEGQLNRCSWTHVGNVRYTGEGSQHGTEFEDFVLVFDLRILDITPKYEPEDPACQ